MLFSSPSNWCVRMKETRPTHWPHHPKKGNAFRPSAYLAWDQAPQRWKKAKTGSKRKNIGERSEPSGGLGRGKGPLPLGSPRSPIFFLFPPMRSLVLSYSLPFPPSIQVIFFLFFCSRQSNFSTNSPGDACYVVEKLMVRRNPHYHFQKYMKMVPVIVFSIWLTSLRTRLLNLFSSKHFAVEDYYPITLSCCC